MKRTIGPLITVFFLLLPTMAGSDIPALDRLYISNRQSLVIGRNQQITNVGDVEDVEPSTAGTRLAYITVDDNGSGYASETVNTIGLTKFQTRNYLTAEATPEASAIYMFVGGWSPDGRFFSVGSLINNPSSTNYRTNILVCDLQSGESPSASDGSNGRPDLFSARWNKADQLLFTSTDSTQSYINVYNAAEGKVNSWPASKGIRAVQWDDASGQVAFKGETTKKWFLLNPDTGAISDKPGTTSSVMYIYGGTADDDVDVPGSNTKLHLTVQSVVAQSVDPAKVIHQPQTDTIWLSVTGLPPLSVKRPPVGYLLVDSSLFDGQSPVFVPHPDQSQPIRIVSIAHGDIFLSTLGFDKATAQEASDAGEALSCPEEEELAEEDAKQLGLGVIEYSQDYDEHFPPADNFHDEVYPYVRSESLFTAVGKFPFAYELDGDALASIADPVTTVVGEFTLPCGKVAVYADGHVKAIPLDQSSKATQAKCPVCAG